MFAAMASACWLSAAAPPMAWARRRSAHHCCNDGANGQTIHVAVGDKVALILGSSYWNSEAARPPLSCAR
jgi:hypothetical protein